MTFEMPARGFVFWPVGCGDSTTVKVDENIVMQVDIRHMSISEDEDEPYHPVVDTLVEEVLPMRDGESKPYLAVFALTHPDEDHCTGFADLLDRTIIGELWFSPRVLRDFKDNAESSEDIEMCEDAIAFAEEVERRIALNQGTEADSGDRIRIIGSDDILSEDDYADIPDDLKSRPGDTVGVLDGTDLDGTFKAFIHSPFGDDSTKERNKTSLGMQVTLTEGEVSGRAMLLGDLDYPPLKRIFVEYSDEENTAWDVLLAPHHCSKSAMYFKEEGDDEPVLKQDFLDALQQAAGDEGWVVASSTKVPASNEPGDNPPHALAKARYEEVAPSGFLCTGDDEDSDDPIVFEVSVDGISLLLGADEDSATSSLAAAIEGARGGEKPAATPVGFGGH